MTQFAEGTPSGSSHDRVTSRNLSSAGVSLSGSFLRQPRRRLAPPRARLAAPRLGDVALRSPRCTRRTVDAPDHSINRWCATCEPGAPPRALNSIGAAKPEATFLTHHAGAPEATFLTHYVGSLPRAGGPVTRDDRTSALPFMDRGRRQEPARRVPRGRLGASWRIIRAGGGERRRARVVRHHRNVFFGVPAEEGGRLSGI